MQPPAPWPLAGGVVLLPADAEAPGTKAGQPRLLLVEDDWLICLQIERFLKAAGFAIVGVAADAATAIALAERERPDLVLMDIRLSGPVDGIAAAQEIVDRFGIRSLFVSAHDDPGTLARSSGARPLGWVPKPFTEVELLRGVEAALAAR
jgi:DNA-binding NarL/FixJ family response regulator